MAEFCLGEQNLAQAIFANPDRLPSKEEDYHPMIITEYGWVTITWWTHQIGGLHKNEFTMAAKSDEIFSG